MRGVPSAFSKTGSSGLDELLEVLHKAQEWNPAEVVVAKRLLAERGVEVDQAEIIEKQEENLTAIRQPVRGSYLVIALGLLFCILGGVLGLLLGWSYAATKERDPTGKEYPRYDARTRADACCLSGAVICVLAVADDLAEAVITRRQSRIAFTDARTKATSDPGRCFSPMG